MHASGAGRRRRKGGGSHEGHAAEDKCGADAGRRRGRVGERAGERAACDAAHIEQDRQVAGLLHDSSKPYISKSPKMFDRLPASCAAAASQASVKALR